MPLRGKRRQRANSESAGNPVVKPAILLGAIVGMVCYLAAATPSPETAKRCLRAAYLLYPYKRPGAAPMNGDRLLYLKKCMAEREVV
jgi:hypothetical protein